MSQFSVPEICDNENFNSFFSAFQAHVDSPMEFNEADKATMRTTSRFFVQVKFMMLFVFGATQCLANLLRGEFICQCSVSSLAIGRKFVAADREHPQSATRGTRLIRLPYCAGIERDFDYGILELHKYVCEDCNHFSQNWTVIES
jgi:hypothetical protein